MINEGNVINNIQNLSLILHFDCSMSMDPVAVMAMVEVYIETYRLDALLASLLGRGRGYLIHKG